MSTIVAALISAAAAILVGAFNSNVQHRKMMVDLAKRDGLYMYRVEQLEKKVDLHNNLVERTYQLEQTTTVQDERIRVANHRISDLEKNDRRQTT